MEESNPWPTFVDAFSSVLCIFIFLMLVFVLNSMLIMYESSKKRYEATSLVEQIINPVTSSVNGNDDISTETEGPAGTGVNPENHSISKSSSSQFTAQEPASEQQVETTPQITDSQTNTQESQIINQNNGSGDKKNGDIIRLANNEDAASIKGQNSGRFDSKDVPPVWEVKDNQFIIHFKGMEQGYPADVIEEMNKWLATGHPVSITVYAQPTSTIAVSDAMRLAYERGVILLKILKSQSPNGEISISVVNNASALSNSAVITRSE